MDIGKLNKRLAIERPTRTVDARTGQRAPSAWEVLATVWAAVWPRATRERELSEHLGNVITHEVRMRYRSDVTTNCRLKLGTRVLAIVGIDNVDERNRELRITATEQGAT